MLTNLFCQASFGYAEIVEDVFLFNSGKNEEELHATETDAEPVSRRLRKKNPCEHKNMPSNTKASALRIKVNSISHKNIF